jgi:hypothetical protein
MNHKKYIFGLLFATLISAVLFKLTFTSSLRCDAFGGGPGKFMAYCDVSTHGHYDHAAYLFDLEEGLTDQVRQANLLFLGSSRSQFAFSTSSLTDFVSNHPSVRPYLLGFGHVEQDVFSEKVLDRIRPSPAVIVINADPFFAQIASDHAKQLLSNGETEKTNAQIKKFWHPISEAACNDRIPVIGQFICGTHNTVYRSVQDGRWIWHDKHVATTPVSDLQPTSLDDAVIKKYASNAEAFISKLAVDRRCVVLTFIPTGKGKPFVAQGIARKLGIPFIAPQLDKLFTYDGSHLDDASGERWSKAFLSELEPLLASCLH